MTLDTRYFNRKPTSRETGGITNRLKAASGATVTASQFCEHVRRGGTFVCGAHEPACGSGWGRFLSQQIFALDFDNSTGSKGEGTYRALQPAESGYIDWLDALDRMKADAPLLDRIRHDTGEAGHESGNRIDFRKCPVCGHKDDFRYFPDTNSWKCFSASDGRGGTYVDYLMAVDGLTESQAITALREATGHPRQAKRSVELVAAFPEIPFDRAERSGNIKPTPGNILLAIKDDAALRSRIRRNAMTGAIEFARPLPWSKDGEAGAEELETALAQLTVHIERKYKIAAKKHDIDTAVRVHAANNSYDPVIERFKRLPRWDGERRVDFMLEAFLKAEPTPYVRAASQLMVCGIIERQLNPGAKFDYMVVLEGPQGCGKSTFCEMLALDREFYCENMQNMDSGNTDALIVSQGRTVVEVGELNALKRAKTAEAAKAFITATRDEYRGKYQREAVKHPRRFIVIGTTNEREFLTDTTGNRRYLPIACHAKEPTRYIGTDEGREYMEGRQRIRSYGTGTAWEIL